MIIARREGDEMAIRDKVRSCNLFLMIKHDWVHRDYLRKVCYFDLSSQVDSQNQGLGRIEENMRNILLVPKQKLASFSLLLVCGCLLLCLFYYLANFVEVEESNFPKLIRCNDPSHIHARYSSFDWTDACHLLCSYELVQKLRLAFLLIDTPYLACLVCSSCCEQKRLVWVTFS